jgi:hypothetical protein
MDFICLYEVEQRFRGKEDGGDLTNVQYKPIQNCHYESLPYNKNILIKIYKQNKTK